MANDPEFALMTPGELRGVLADLGLSNEQAADLIGVAKSTLDHWVMGSQTMPTGPAVILLRMLRADPKLTGRVKAVKGKAGPEAPPRPRGRQARPPVRG